MLQLQHLKRRADFLRCTASPQKYVGKAFVLQGIEGYSDVQDSAFIGFTASKKVGNAVIRNRVKRRLRALASEILPASAQSGWAYVLVGRKNCVQYPYDRLREDLHEALQQIHQ